jgi:hypothetical protein
MTTLDTFTDKVQETEPQHIITDAEARYLYEQSWERQVEKMYAHQIEDKLAEERKEEESHKNYIKTHYIRVGGN